MKENFKLFVKANPKLIDYVKENNVSWQSLFEIYSLYGEDEIIWNKYMNSSNSSVDELVKLIKKVNIETVKNTVDSLQKAVSILQSIGNKDNTEEYEKSRKYEDLDD